MGGGQGRFGRSNPKAPPQCSRFWRGQGVLGRCVGIRILPSPISHRTIRSPGSRTGPRRGSRTVRRTERSLETMVWAPRCKQINPETPSPRTSADVDFSARPSASAFEVCLCLKGFLHIKRVLSLTFPRNGRISCARAAIDKPSRSPWHRDSRVTRTGSSTCSSSTGGACRAWRCWVRHGLRNSAVDFE